jgi:hypothetical protein
MMRSLAGAWSCVALLTFLARPVRAEPPGSSLGSLSISLSLARGISDTGQETRGFVVLRVPLERFSAPSRSALLAANDAPAASESTEPDDAESAEQEPPQEENASQAASLPPPRWVLTPSLVRAALAAAQKASGYARTQDRLSSLSTRSKSSALLPELGLRAAHSTDESLRAASTLDDPYRYTAAGGADLALEARATWRLDRLVFADEELAVERLRSEAEKERLRLRERVLEKLFAWQRALLKAENQKLSAEARSLFLLAALEAELELDALTAGWFSAALAKEALAE